MMMAKVSTRMDGDSTEKSQYMSPHYLRNNTVNNIAQKHKIQQHLKQQAPQHPKLQPTHSHQHLHQHPQHRDIHYPQQAPQQHPQRQPQQQKNPQQQNYPPQPQQQQPPQPLLQRGQLLCSGRFCVDEPLALESGFGQVWLGKDLTNPALVVIKTESYSAKPQTLPFEAQALMQLNQRNAQHVLKLLSDGFEQSRTGLITYIVLPRAGPDLEQLQDQNCYGLFTSAIAYRLGIQELSAIRSVHECGWLHRDIKPANFVVHPALFNRGRLHLYLIDFGLSAPYMSNGRHLPQRSKVGFHGAPRWASLSAHIYADVSRRDDVWSALYTMLGHVCVLPWTHLDNIHEIQPIKRNTMPQLVYYSCKQLFIFVAGK